MESQIQGQRDISSDQKTDAVRTPINGIMDPKTKQHIVSHCYAIMFSTIYRIIRRMRSCKSAEEVSHSSAEHPATMTKRRLDESPDDSPAAKRRMCVYDDPGFSHHFSLLVFDNRLKELDDVLYNRRCLFELSMTIKQSRSQYLEKICKADMMEIIPFFLPKWLKNEKGRVDPIIPKLEDIVQVKRPIFEGHTDHEIETIIRVDVLKWGVKVRTGRFLPDEILDVIMSFMEGDFGGRPGWFLRSYSIYAKEKGMVHK